MAKINGIKALFNSKTVRDAIDTQVRAYEDTIIDRFTYAGEQFVNNAREKDTYKDRTGNLRASIGYLILHEGTIVRENFRGKTKAGVEKAKAFAREMSGYYPKGYVLIGVAGMNYAAAVEAKGYDVISGSEPTADMMREILER